MFGAVTWPREQDIAPETLLAEMQPLDSATAELLAAEPLPQYEKHD